MSKDLFFGNLRSLLAQKPSVKAFVDIWQTLGLCQDKAVLEHQLLPYVEEHLSTWGKFRHINFFLSENLFSDARLPLLESVTLIAVTGREGLGEDALKPFALEDYHLNKFKNLKHLSFDLGYAPEAFHEHTWYAINYSTIVSQLDSLALRHVTLQDIRHTPQSTLSNLKSLDVEFVHLPLNNTSYFVSSLVREVADKPRLQNLRLVGSPLRSDSITRSLPAFAADSFCRKMLYAASSFTELEHLDLSATDLSHNGLTDLCENPWLAKLSSLTIDHTPVMIPPRMPPFFSPRTFAVSQALRALGFEVES